MTAAVNTCVKLRPHLLTGHTTTYTTTASSVRLGSFEHVVEQIWSSDRVQHPPASDRTSNFPWNILFLSNCLVTCTQVFLPRSEALNSSITLFTSCTYRMTLSRRCSDADRNNEQTTIIRHRIILTRSTSTPPHNYTDTFVSDNTHGNNSS